MAPVWEEDRNEFAARRGPLLDSADDSLEPAVRRMLRYYANRQGIGVARFAQAVTRAAQEIWEQVFDELWIDPTPVREEGLTEFQREFSDAVALTERPPKGEPQEDPEAFDVRVWRVTRWASVFTVNHATMWAGRAALNDPDVEGVFTEWLTMGDGRVRETHQEADGQTVPVGEPFDIGGYPLRFPGDSQNGPLEEVMNCFPADTLVYGDVNGAYRRPYSGPMIEVITGEGKNLTGTPNHPVLTDKGWVALHRLQEGDNLLTHRTQGHTAVGHDIQGCPSKISEVFDALTVTGDLVRVGGSRVDFHGDVPDGDVEVVSLDRELRHSGKTTADEFFRQFLLPPSDTPTGALQGHRAAREGLHGVNRAASSGMSGRGEQLLLLGGGRTHADAHGGGSVTGGDAVPHEEGSQGASSDAELASKGLLGLPGQVTLDHVVRVRRIEGWSGHVYNLSTQTGAYVGNGIIVHNCRCVLRLLTEEMMTTMTRNKTLAAFKARAEKRRLVPTYRALYAVDAVAAAASPPPPAEAPARGRAFVGVAAIEGQETGDSRLLERGALTWEQDVNLPLRARLEGDHDGMVVGTINRIARDGDLIRIFGWLHASEHPEVAALVRRVEELITERLAGLSVGIDKVDAEVRIKPELMEELNDDEVNAAPPREEDAEGRIVVWRWNAKDQVTAFTSSRIREVSVVDQAAIFPGSGLELVEEEAIAAAAGGRTDPAFLNPMFGKDGDVDPRLSWQDPLRHDEVGHWGAALTVTEDGRVYGHLATKGRCHSGYGDACLNITSIDPSYTFSDYLVGDATGTGVPTGTIIVGESHRVRPDGSVTDWDMLSNSRFGVADVTCGVDDHGIWVAGRVRPGATKGQIAQLRGSALSGEWVPTPTGARRLKAIVAVNTPGFAIARRPVAAAGALYTTGPVCTPCQEEAQAALDAQQNTTRFARLRELLS